MARVLYFATLVDRLGTATEEIALSPDVATVGDLLRLLRRRGGSWEETFGSGMVRVTVNKQFAGLDTPVADGDEIAFISGQM